MDEQITEKTDLEKALDGALADLSKAAGEISKGEGGHAPWKGEGEEAHGGEADEEKKREDEEKKKKEAEDLKAKEKEKEDMKAKEGYNKGGKKEEEDIHGSTQDFGGRDEKSLRAGIRAEVMEDLRKAKTVENAVEVSPFLRDLVKSIGEMMGDFAYRIRTMEKSNAAFAQALAKSHVAQAEMLKSMSAEVSTASGRPLPRKAVDARGIATMEKAFRGGGDDKPQLSKAQVSDKLANLELEGKVPFNSTAKFESTGQMTKAVEALVLGEPRA